MKKIALLITAALAVAPAFAAQAKSTKASHPAKAASTHHDVSAEVVSVDATAHTITLKTDKGEQTVPVEGKAQASLKNYKAGQHVTVTCRDENGEHKAVTAIKASGAKAAKS
jgi:Cu/Ag efflux protein CusF